MNECDLIQDHPIQWYSDTVLEAATFLQKSLLQLFQMGREENRLFTEFHGV